MKTPKVLLRIAECCVLLIGVGAHGAQYEKCKADPQVALDCTALTKTVCQTYSCQYVPGVDIYCADAVGPVACTKSTGTDTITFTTVTAHDVNGEWVYGYVPNPTGDCEIAYFLYEDASITPPKKYYNVRTVAWGPPVPIPGSTGNTCIEFHLGS